MKIGVLFFSLIISVSAFAGGYYSPSIDDYDPDTGLYYKSVSSKEKSGFLSEHPRSIVNLYIYDPTSDKGVYLFPEKKNFQIVSITFEKAVEGGSVDFFNQYSFFVKNNHHIEPRKPKSSMLIVTQDIKTEEKTFYLAEKDGSTLTEIMTIAPSQSWHIDVKNSVVRVVTQSDLEITIENFKW